jgi:lipopolysaccharide biosynthesis protein
MSKVFCSSTFRDFFKKVKQEHCKSDIIKKYEIGLTTHFINCGFKMDSFIKKIFEINPTLDVASYRFIIQNDFPFIKVCAIANNPEIKKIIFEDYLKNDSFMFKYIYNHTKKIKDDKNLTITSQHSNLTNLTTISQYTDVMPIDQTNLLMKKIKKLKKIRKKYLQAIVLLITLLIIILCKIAVRNYNTI